MAVSSTRKRWLIIIGSIIAVLIILLIALNSVLSGKAESFVREKLSAMDTTNYHIDFEKISVNIFSSTVKIYNIRIKPSDSALEKVKFSKLAGPVVEANISRIKVGNISIIKAIKGEAFNVGTVLLSDPEITVYSPQGMFPDKKTAHSDKSIFSSDTVVESPVKEATLGTFEIRNANLKWMDMSKEELVLETRDLNIKVDDIWIHNPDGDTLSYVLDVEDISIQLQSHMMKLPGALYTVQTGPIDINYKDKQFSLDSLQLIPAYSKVRFGQVVGKQTDRFEVSIGNLLITGIEFDSLLKKKVIIEKVFISNPSADIYRDKRIARDMSIFPKLFQTAFAGIPIPVKVMEVNVDNANLNYQEMVEGAQEAGSVIFEQLAVKIIGLNNDPELIKNGQAIIGDVTGLFMGEALLTVHFDLPIGNPDEYFTFYGSTESFKATLLNPMIKYLAFIEATGGTINSCKFYAMAKRDIAVGRVELLYTDMEIIVIKKQKENEEMNTNRKFLSFVAKTAMHKNNPMPDKPVRIALTDFVRDPNKGFFNYVWKPVQTGLINSITPMKSKHAQDMDWPGFAANWEKVLQGDWEQLNKK